jgi:hypothetical protein
MAHRTGIAVSAGDRDQERASDPSLQLRVHVIPLDVNINSEYKDEADLSGRLRVDTDYNGL